MWSSIEIRTSFAGYKSRHTACLYGDASHRELLMKAGAADASLIIVALPEIEPAALAVQSHPRRSIRKFRSWPAPMD